MAANNKTRAGKKRRRWPYWIGGILLLVLLAAGGYTYYLYNQLDNTVEEIQQPLDREQTDSEEDKKRIEERNNTVRNRQTLNFLLLGVDERAGDRGRSDTMIFLSVNPNTESILMLSIPRDSYVEIPGRGMDKINHTYAFGGSSLAVETVENVLDVPIHFYLRVNMEGFESGIDALGGITVHNEFEFTQGGETFPEGKIELNGQEALRYARMRKQDPEGDFGRTERQRQVLQAAMDKVANFSSISKVDDMLSIVGDNVRTDMDLEIIRTLFTHYRQARNDITTLQVDGEGGTLSDGIWYYQVPEEEWKRISEAITEHMRATE